MKHTFKKEEKVVSQKIISSLFHKESPTFFVYPFKASLILTQNEGARSQVLIIVPKRNFKLAVKRNIIKRQMRELFRLNKSILNTYLETNQLQVAISLTFVSQKQELYAVSDLAIKKLFDLIKDHLEKNLNLTNPALN
jgi:ribonuclease P protein component